MIDKIFDVIKNNVIELENVELKRDTSLIASGYMDSFEVIMLLQQLEQVFNIYISLDSINLEDFETPERIEEMILEIKNKDEHLKHT